MIPRRIKAAVLSANFPKWLLGAFCVWFAIWAIGPSHPDDFLLEHVLTGLFVGCICWTYRRFRLSNFSYTLIFIFLCLHVVGAHYTYSEVPYEAWCRQLAGVFGDKDFDIRDWFGWERNHYDRLVHFSFGLLMAYPVREVFVRIVRVRGFWGYYLPLDVMMSFSMIYELFEWLVAVYVGGDVGESYLGAQGDPWDAQKDMALATTGGLIAMTLTALVNWYCDRDFAAEFIASLKSRESQPLGEVKLADMLEQRHPPQQT